MSVLGRVYCRKGSIARWVTKVEEPERSCRPEHLHAAAASHESMATNATTAAFKAIFVAIALY